MDETILIKLVSKYEELYNLKHSLYSNQQRRENIWGEIGDILKENGIECRERWTKIRDNYRRALQLRKTKTVQAASKLKPPKYNKELSFLVPYLYDEENRSSNVPSIGSTNTSNIDPATDSEDCSFPFASTIVSPTDSQGIHSTFTSRKRSRSRNSDDNSTAFVLRDYLNHQTTRERSATRSNSYSIYEQDPLTGFFINMATTVRGFPIEEQIRIKNELFQNVNNTELRLALKSASPCHTSTSSTTPGFWSSSLLTNDMELREQTTLVSQPHAAVTTATSSIIPTEELIISDDDTYTTTRVKIEKL